MISGNLGNISNDVMAIYTHKQITTMDPKLSKIPTSGTLIRSQEWRYKMVKIKTHL